MRPDRSDSIPPAGDVVIRVVRAGSAGADLRIGARAVAYREPLARRRSLVEVVDARPASLAAVIRIATDLRAVREHAPLRALVFDVASARARLAAPVSDPQTFEEVLRLERVLDELRAQAAIDDLFEWLLRGRPRADEISGERLSLAWPGAPTSRSETRRWSAARLSSDLR